VAIITKTIVIKRGAVYLAPPKRKFRAASLTIVLGRADRTRIVLLDR